MSFEKKSKGKKIVTIETMGEVLFCFLFCFFFFFYNLQCITRKRKNTKDNLSYNKPLRQGADYLY